MEEQLSRSRWTPWIAAGLLAIGPSLQAAPPSAKDVQLWAKLEERLESVRHRLDGVLGYSLKDLETGATLGVLADEPFPTASSIKVAILLELYGQAEQGRVDLAEVTRPGGPRVPGGILFDLGDQVSLTWRDLAVLMMGLSDNEATNILIGRLGLDAVNARLDLLGLRDTRLRRRMMDLAAARRGEENVSTPAELRRLMEVVREGAGLPPERARDLWKLATLAKDSPFRRPLPDSLAIADKPGELEGVRCVTAVVAVPGRPYSIAVMTSHLKRDRDGDRAIEQISESVFETFDRLARSSPLGRIISER